MKTIPLTQSKVALVDDEDFDFASWFKWRAIKNGKTWYAQSVVYLGKVSGKSILGYMLLHQLIMRPPKDMQVDHKNHDGLNCRRENMRICTKTQNQYNQRHRQNTSSQFKGVSWNKRARKWVAYIGYDNKTIYLGLFTSEIEAAQTYDRAAIKYFGEFACTNFPKEDYA